MNERGYRDTALIQSMLLIALFFSATLPWFGRRNVFHELDDHPLNAFVVMLHFGMPLIAGAITAARLLRGRTPQRASFWMMTFQELLKAIAAILALIALLIRMSFSPETLAAFAGIVLLVIVQLVALLRGSRREGWERWAHLLAAMTPWHLFVAGALFLEQGNHHPLPGPQLYFFSVAALLPLMVWALWPRPRTAEETPPPQPTAG